MLTGILFVLIVTMTYWSLKIVFDFNVIAAFLDLTERLLCQFMKAIVTKLTYTTVHRINSLFSDEKFYRDAVMDKEVAFILSGVSGTGGSGNTGTMYIGKPVVKRVKKKKKKKSKKKK